MSHWGATVITNLLSAIPFIGTDLVPFKPILPLYFIYIYIFIFILYIDFFFKNINLNDDISIARSKAAVKLDKEINISSYKKEDINLILLYKFIGFIDGDGYIRVTKKKKNIEVDYIYISLIINLNENELNLLNIFNKEFNLGKVYNITPKKGNKLVRLEINKTDFKNILIPLLDKYNIQFLTEVRQKQYLLAKYILNNNIINYNDIKYYKKDIDNYINNNIIKYKFNNLSYFNYWLVGFTMAEGSFYTKKNNDICFQLKQKYNFELFYDIKKVFSINKGISINKDKYIQLTISSKKDIQKVISFFSQDNYLLLGYKNIEFNKWLLDLKSSNRYKNLYIKFKI